MLNVLSNLWNIVIPLLVFYVVATGLINKKKVYVTFKGWDYDGRAITGNITVNAKWDA